MRYLLLLCLFLTSCHGFIHAENDVFTSAISGNSDRYYTHGTKFGAIKETDTTRETYSLGQNIYTPSNYSTYAPTESLEKDRPYTGWLYVEYLKTAQTNPTTQDTYGLQLGCVGVCSLARQTQQEFHRIIDQYIPEWQKDYQQRSEPGAVVILKRRKALAAKSLTNYVQADLQGYGGTKLGNIIDDLEVGVDSRIGYNLPQFKPDEIVFKTSSTPSIANPYSIYFFTKTEQRIVGYNHLLQGSFINSENHRVTPEWAVTELGVGLALAYDYFKLSYTYTYLSQEWTTENGGFVFGGIDIEW